MRRALLVGTALAALVVAGSSIGLPKLLGHASLVAGRAPAILAAPDTKRSFHSAAVLTETSTEVRAPSPVATSLPTPTREPHSRDAWRQVMPRAEAPLEHSRPRGLENLPERDIYKNR
jgi:hypothetical protein